MSFFTKFYGLFLLVVVCNAYGLGRLTVANKTIGLLKPVVARGDNEHFFRVTIPQDEQFSQANLIDIGDRIDFRPGDTSGPLLPTVVVQMLYGRPANVTITCDGDQCDVTQD